RFVFVGGAGNREKGLAVLLAATRSLPADGWRLDCHGVTVEDVAADGRGDGPIRLHPSFAPEAIEDVLGSADVVVVPSLMRESFWLVTREALARGVPVVTTDCGGPEEVVRDGENGLVVPTGAPALLASALRRLIDDRSFLERLAENAWARFPTPAEQT